MTNPPAIHLAAGAPQTFGVVVTANNVQPDGSNPGAIDLTTPLTITSIQNAAGQAVTAMVDPGNNRRIVCTPATLAPGAGSLPWSFRVSAPGYTGSLVASGDTAAPPDVSGVVWDGLALA